MRDHRPISAIEQPLVAVGKVLFEGFHAFDDFLTGTRLEDLAKRADVRVGLGRTGENLSDRPFPTFVDVILWTGVLHGVVEMAEMSQVNAQPRKSVLLEHSRPENRICPIIIIGVWPEAVAGMRHDGHIIGAAPRVELCESSIELAAGAEDIPVEPDEPKHANARDPVLGANHSSAFSRYVSRIHQSCRSRFAYQARHASPGG